MKSFNKVSIWSDGGNHFRSQEFISFVFEELYFKQEKKVKINYFAEYHGKSIVDGHFGVISRWLKDMTKTKKINDMTELISGLSEKERIRQEMAEMSFYKDLTSPQSKFYFLTYDRSCRSKKRTYQMEDMKNYLSFFTNDNKLYKSVFSYIKLENYSRINFTKKEEDDKRPTKRSFTDEDFKHNFKNNKFIGKKSYAIQQTRKKFMSDFHIYMEP